MRKAFSIVFALLILFNILGYYGIFLGLDYKNDLEVSQKLDSENYIESETITIKVPLTMPYGGPTSNDFERVDGEFEHNGEFYRLVKQRFSSDTLYVVCVKDYQGKSIEQALDNYVKTFSDKPVSSQQATKIFSTFIKDYIGHTFSIKNLSCGWERKLTHNLLRSSSISDFSPSIIHPPERCWTGYHLC